MKQHGTEFSAYKNLLVRWDWSGELWYASPCNKRTKKVIKSLPSGTGITRRLALSNLDRELTMLEIKGEK